MNLKENDLSSLKVTVSSIAYDIKLTTNKSTNDKLSKFLHGPAIKSERNNDIVLFGGNAICKSLSLLQNNNNNSIWIQYGSEIDKWLEYERAILHCANDKNKNKFTKLEKKLELNGIYYLFKENILSPADICIITTLSQQNKDDAALPKIIQEYMNYHLC